MAPKQSSLLDKDVASDLGEGGFSLVTPSASSEPEHVMASDGDSDSDVVSVRSEFRPPSPPFKVNAFPPLDKKKKKPKKASKVKYHVDVPPPNVDSIQAEFMSGGVPYNNDFAPDPFARTDPFSREALLLAENAELRRKLEDATMNNNHIYQLEKTQKELQMQMYQQDQNAFAANNDLRQFMDQHRVDCGQIWDALRGVLPVIEEASEARVHPLGADHGDPFAQYRPIDLGAPPVIDCPPPPNSKESFDLARAVTMDKIDFKNFGSKFGNSKKKKTPKALAKDKKAKPWASMPAPFDFSWMDGKAGKAGKKNDKFSKAENLRWRCFYGVLDVLHLMVFFAVVYQLSAMASEGQRVADQAQNARCLGVWIKRG